MKKYLLPILAIVICSLTLIGWIWDIQFLTNFNADLSTIKSTTATCLLIISIMQLFIISDCGKENYYKEIVASALAAWVWLIMIIVITSFVISGDTIARNSTVDGMPSIVTIMGALLCSSAGWIYIWNTRKVVSRILWIGIGAIVIGALALTGYITHVPLLYFYVEQYGLTAMSPIAAVVFIIIGIKFITISICLKEIKAKNI